MSSGSSKFPYCSVYTECGRYLLTSSGGLITLWQLPSMETSKLPLRSASNQGPVGRTRWVTCKPILLHSSTSQTPRYLKGWSTLRLSSSKLAPSAPASFSSEERRVGKESRSRLTEQN